MTTPSDEVLERELAKLGSLGGLLGGGLAGALGGATGAKWAARRLSSSSAEGTIEVPMSARDAFAQAFNALSEVGEVLPDEIEQNTPTVRAVVGSGALGMNPAVVDISVEQLTDHAAKLTIRATAKEGLIKQHTAEKVVRGVIEAIGWGTESG